MRSFSHDDAEELKATQKAEKPRRITRHDVLTGLNQGFRLHHRPWILKKYPRHLKAKNINKELGSVSDPLVLYSRVKVQHILKTTLFPCICKPSREHGHKVMHMITMMTIGKNLKYTNCYEDASEMLAGQLNM